MYQYRTTTYYTLKSVLLEPRKECHMDPVPLLNDSTPSW